MANLSLSLGLLHAFVHSAAVPRPPALIHHVELIDVHVIRLQVSEGSLQILPKILRRLGRGLCGDVHVIANGIAIRKASFPKSSSHLLFTVRVCPGSIEKSHAAVIRFPKKLHRFLLGYPLNRQRAKSILWDGNSRISQCHCSHDVTLPLIKMNFELRGPPACLFQVREAPPPRGGLRRVCWASGRRLSPLKLKSTYCNIFHLITYKLSYLLYHFCLILAMIFQIFIF